LIHQGGYPEQDQVYQNKPVRLKSFNLLVAEIGPNVLKKGIFLGGGSLKTASERYLNVIRQTCRSAPEPIIAKISSSEQVKVIVNQPFGSKRPNGRATFFS
jgi:hypothetical protein